MLSRYEKETIIIFNEAEEEAIISTLSNGVVDRFIKAGYEPEKLDKDSYRFRVSKESIKVLILGDKRKGFYPSGKNI
ncbi:hypothetical protein JYA63_17395 [Fictibacillus nanhaiensis]|uniref:Uncharacterized protein n=1 Tax=Fictibacillus nanhaiensis TaxID=742169 RepID=A0ABS2ZT51_9BACL|nr:hypothetical protein [Fictibacillus nanhaiensis]